MQEGRTDHPREGFLRAGAIEIADVFDRREPQSNTAGGNQDLERGAALGDEGDEGQEQDDLCEFLAQADAADAVDEVVDQLAILHEAENLLLPDDENARQGDRQAASDER